MTNCKDLIPLRDSFYGGTISTASTTGQDKHRSRFNPLMPHYRFINFGDVKALEETLDDQVAAMILEPIQGKGGVRVPSDEYLI